MAESIRLGQTVEDPISGVVGVVVGITEWLYGCRRLSVQRKGVDKDFKPHELFNVDEPQVRIVPAKKRVNIVKPQANTPPAGPRDGEPISRY